MLTRLLVTSFSMLVFCASASGATGVLPAPSSVHVIAQAAPPQVPAPGSVPLPVAAGKTRWAPYGTYTPGQRVQYYISSDWRTGTVRAVGPGPTSAKSPADYEMKYQIAQDKFPDSPDWIDWGRVAGIERAPFWTDFFIGDWATGEVMAVNSRIEGRREVTEFSYHTANDVLRVNGDGTYQWKVSGSPEIRGKWQPASDGPGLLLLNGYRNTNWTLRNETNASEEYIRGIESARLYPEKKSLMTIRAKRPLPGGKNAR